MPSEKILVVDDERSIAEAIKYNLTKAGYRVVTAADGETGLERCRAERPDLVILDLMLPKVDGFEVCRLLKQQAATRAIPIVILSVKSDETDKIVGLELGADDYLTKPFSPRELTARIKAILRRTKPAEPSAAFDAGDLRVEWAKHLVTVKRKPVELTPKEFELLHSLVDAHGRVLSREFLLDRVWGYSRAAEIETRTVDLHISQLRKKLAAAGTRIVTVKQAGYRFATDE